MVSLEQPSVADLFIIGGGINGCGIARDAVGRGLSVVLAEQGDLAQATSSASTKLFHGGLRYLEYFEFRLVREALEELAKDHEFLLSGDVFTRDQLEGYMALKWEEVYAYEHTPHPIEYLMYYSC